jgi:hypothetical protein
LLGACGRFRIPRAAALLAKLTVPYILFIVEILVYPELEWFSEHSPPPPKGLRYGLAVKARFLLDR